MNDTPDTPPAETVTQEMVDIVAEAIWRGVIDTREKPWPEVNGLVKDTCRDKARSALEQALSAPAPQPPADADVIIKDGFPEGWFIQDRPSEGVALLCKPNWQFGSRCLCLRPGAIPTEDWVPEARAIAEAIVAREKALHASRDAEQADADVMTVEEIADLEATATDLAKHDAEMTPIRIDGLLRLLTTARAFHTAQDELDAQTKSGTREILRLNAQRKDMKAEIERLRAALAQYANERDDYGALARTTLRETQKPDDA